MFGPYRLDGLLGSGGMGEVHRAYHVDQDRTVALKLLHADLGADDEFRRRFLRESRVTARLTDPHVIPIHNWGAIDGRLYLDMRLVEGEDLGELLDRSGRLPPARTVALLSQVARALDSAHRSGLIHRDVKPSNVLLANEDGDDFAYLVDFGIARSLTGDTTGAGITRAGTAVGTLDYMAPERFLEQPVDGRADVYALACVLHECLTGEKPFPVEGLPALMRAHLRTPPPRPSQHRIAAPSTLDDVVARGMAKDPVQRFPTAGALAAAARRALEGSVTMPAGIVRPLQPVPPPRTVAPDEPTVVPGGGPGAIPGDHAMLIDRAALLEQARRAREAGPPAPPRPDAARPEAPPAGRTPPDRTRSDPTRSDHSRPGPTRSDPVRPEGGPGRPAAGAGQAPAAPHRGPARPADATTPMGRATPRQRAATSQVPLPAVGPRPRAAAPPPARPGRRVAIAGAVVVLLAAVAAVAVVLLRPPTPPAPPVDGPSAAERDLLAVLPIGFAAANCTAAPERVDGGVDAALTCTDGPANGPGTAVFLRYRDADALAAAQTADAAARGLPAGEITGCRAGKPTSGGWERGREAGRLACYTEAATGVTIDWTDPRVPARAIVTRSDGDAAVLYDWWSAGGFL